MLAKTDLIWVQSRYAGGEGDCPRDATALFVVVRFHNGLNLIDHSIQLMICGVEVGRNPNAGVRPIIDQHVAARKFTFDFFAVRYVDNHHAATSSRVA